MWEELRRPVLSVEDRWHEVFVVVVDFVVVSQATSCQPLESTSTTRTVTVFGGGEGGGGESTGSGAPDHALARQRVEVRHGGRAGHRTGVHGFVAMGVGGRRRRRGGVVRLISVGGQVEVGFGCDR